MKETPILFSTEMVRTILDGQKSQTRRVIKPQPWLMDRAYFKCFRKDAGGRRCPYGGTGDLLWVRETHEWVTLAEKDPWKDRAIADGTFRRTHKGEPVKMCYKADGEIPAPWRPSIHMPKWAARIWLEIISVRPEQLQDITGLDCIREGITSNSVSYFHDSGDWEIYLGNRKAFARLWDLLNAKWSYSWASNPWVWRIEFKRCDAPR